MKQSFTALLLFVMASLVGLVYYMSAGDFRQDLAVNYGTSLGYLHTCYKSESGNFPMGKTTTEEDSVHSKSLIRNQDCKTPEDEYRARLTRYQDVCAVRKRVVKSSEIVFYYKNPATNRSFSFCAVPKAGCTFWARINQFLNRTSESRNISSPLDITRFEVYYKPLTKLQTSLYNQDKMADAERFFFVRDPYARLMSAYIDKFLLPQFLTWNLYGNIFAKYKGAKFVTGGQPCIPTMVSFVDFIEKIVLSGDANLHWKPVHRLCDPCKLFPHFIGKQETFSEDAKYILQRVGLQHLMTEYSHKTYVGDEIKQMVDFTYSVRDSNEYLRKCFHNIEIASRIWRAFQLNGYLAANMTFPTVKMNTLMEITQRNTSDVKDIVTNFIVKESARAGLSRDQHLKQKRDMVVREFATLSKGTMQKLADKYDVDFRMFGYEKYPSDLFPYTQAVSARDV